MSLVSVIAKPEIFTLEVVPLQSGLFPIFHSGFGGTIVMVTYSNLVSPASGESLDVDILLNGLSIGAPLPKTVNDSAVASTVYRLWDGTLHFPPHSNFVAAITYIAGPAPAPMDGVVIQIYAYLQRSDDFNNASSPPF